MSKWSDASPHLIRRHRILADMTIAEASVASGCHSNTILHAESGKHTPTAKSLNKLAKAYGCKVSDFYEADIPTVRTLATNVIVGYFNDPNYDAARKASIASHLLTQLPEVESEPETESDAKTYDPLKDLVEPDEQ
jgi:transcriptional regulator with XRE-family HTH domain